jgi:hypothetical protein
MPAKQQFVQGSHSISNHAIYGLSVRNALATEVIERYAGKPPKIEMPMGMASNFLPGGPMVKLLASLATQARGEYQLMVRDLCVIYGIPVSALAQPVLTTDERSAQIGIALAAQFTQEFVTSMLTEMAPDLWMNVAAGMVPVLGRLTRGSIDAAITATLTWRLATMAVLYLLNGNAWLGDQQQTAALAKQIVGRPSAQIRGRVRLDDLPYHVPTIYWRLVDGLVEDIQAMRRADSSLTPEAVRIYLQSLGVREDHNDSALNQC